MMEKPIIIKRQEFINDMVVLIEQSGLPAFVIMEVLNMCAREVEPLIQKQYEAAKELFEKEGEDNG